MRLLLAAAALAALLAGCSGARPAAPAPEPEPVTAYTAEGGGGDFSGTGTICDLNKPFTIEGSGVVMEFTPDDELDDADGTYAYSGVMQGITVAGGEFYKIERNEAGEPTGIFGWGVGSVTMDGLTASGYGEEQYTLTALEKTPAECG